MPNGESKCYQTGSGRGPRAARQGAVGHRAHTSQGLGLLLIGETKAGLWLKWQIWTQTQMVILKRLFCFGALRRVSVEMVFVRAT